MRIEQIELRRISLPYVTPFETSGWREEGSHSVIVKVAAEGAEGWGEAPLTSGPWYNEETARSAWVILQDILVPMLLEADLNGPEDVDALFARVRGNKLARSGLEFAAWDLFGRMRGESITAMLGGTRETVSVGVSVGVQQDIDTLLNVVGEYLEAGYRRVKLKIKPGWDIEPTRAIRKTWPDLALQVDANSIYTLDYAEHLAQLDAFNLLLIEQPLAHDDIYDHAKLQQHLKTPICLDESIVSPEHARWAIELGACGVINIKACRVGGLAPAKQIHDLAQANNIPVWCGGMLETGIGRAANVALASMPNFRLPGDISASDRYYKRDVVHNPFALGPNSSLVVPITPGSGAEIDHEFLASITVEQMVFGTDEG
jgi:O-succinylbenzoate synthase